MTFERELHTVRSPRLLCVYFRSLVSGGSVADCRRQVQFGAMGAVSQNDALSAITHDLRQPLHAVLLYLDALDRRTEREDARDILGKARAAAGALSDQLNALTLYNRLSRQDIKPHLEAVDVRDIAASVLKAAPTIAIDPPAAQEIETDAALLTQILTALATNALTHGSGAAKLEFDQDGDDIVFRIRDQGAGIPLEDRARVFDPFVKLQSGGDGLGLGLTNAAQLAALLGARIEIEDAPSGGASVSLYCPRRASAR